MQLVEFEAGIQASAAQVDGGPAEIVITARSGAGEVMVSLTPAEAEHFAFVLNRLVEAT